MGGVKYNPISEAGADDAVDPAVVGGKQIYKRLTAVGKNPVPINLGRLGAGSAGGIVAESSAQQLMNLPRGGQESENPYVKSLEQLGSRIIGGATSGAIYGKNPASTILGAIGGAAVDAGENIYGLAQAVPEMIQLQRDADLRLAKDRAATAKTAWENLQKEQKKRDLANLAENNK